MHQIHLSDTGSVIHPHATKSVQEWIRIHADEGASEIQINVAQVALPGSSVLIALSLAAREAAALGLPIVLLNASHRVRTEITHIGLTELGISIEPYREKWTSKPRPSRPVILVVDDEPICRCIVVNMLAMAGCESCQAENGVRAIDVCRNRTIDLVLMDVSMPLMDGYEATWHIRSLARLLGKRIPILGLSSRKQDDDQLAGLAAGMDDHLEKPIELEQLAQTMRRWLPGRIPAVVELDEVVG